MRRIVRSVQALLADNAGQAGLNQSDFQALVRLVAADGLPGAELRRILGMTSSSITELADRLESAKMIARTRSPTDRRLVVLKPTARGRKAVERALGPVLGSMAAALDELTDEEYSVVSRFLDDVAQRLSSLTGL